MSAASEFKPLSLCVLTVSDTRTADNDTSGDYLCDALGGAGHRLHQRAIVRDDKYAMRALVSRWIADAGVDGIIVTGGTGSGNIDASTADTLRTALEKVGVTVNPTLWDFYATGAGKDYTRANGGTVSTASATTAGSSRAVMGAVPCWY